MTLHIYEELEQGTEEWLAARCGLVTASTVGQLITAKTVKPAANDYSRALTASLVAERITGHVEPIHETQAMLRGTLDEPLARAAYAEHKGVEVEQIGFMVREEIGFRAGYSPDGLVGDDGLIEIKSRAQKKHLQTIIADEVPLENIAQIQCGLLVSGRAWCDYVSYCGGMKLYIKRVFPDQQWFQAIIAAVGAFEQIADDWIALYRQTTEGMPDTERIDHFAEMEIF